MYLSELNAGEKKNFLELAKHGMGLNGEHKEEELEVYMSFVHECGLVHHELEKQDKIPSVIKILAKSGGKSKRIVLLELLGILLADGVLCEEENTFIDELSESFEIDGYEAKKIQRWVQAMNDLASEGYGLINKE